MFCSEKKNINNNNHKYSATHYQISAVPNQDKTTSTTLSFVPNDEAHVVQGLNLSKRGDHRMTLLWSHNVCFYCQLLCWWCCCCFWCQIVIVCVGLSMNFSKDLFSFFWEIFKMFETGRSSNWIVKWILTSLKCFKIETKWGMRSLTIAAPGKNVTRYAVVVKCEESA